jgi:pimeloyl-ACP methyl ester carboxylesterase
VASLALFGPLMAPPETARRAIRERATAVRAIGDRRSDARTQVLSRCGHWPTLERPQDVNAALRDV